MTADALAAGSVGDPGADGVVGGDVGASGGVDAADERGALPGAAGGVGDGVATEGALPSVAEAVLAMGDGQGQSPLPGITDIAADDVSAGAGPGALPSVAEAVLAMADAQPGTGSEQDSDSGAAADAVTEAVAEMVGGADVELAAQVPASVAPAAEPSALPPFVSPNPPPPPPPLANVLPVYFEPVPAPHQPPPPVVPTPRSLLNRPPLDGLNLWRGVSRAGRATRVGLAAAVVIACAADLPSPRSAPVIDDQQASVSAHERAHSGTGGAPFHSDAGKAGGEILPSVGVRAGEPDCRADRPAGWLQEENRIPGTAAWQDAKHTRAGTVNGYLNRASVQCGDTVTAYLSSPVPVSGATLSAYRMGYYGGAGGRLVWQTKHLSIDPQAQAAVTGSELLTEAPWKASLSFHITGQWTPGYYLLVVRAPGQTASSIPLVVRADGDTAPLGFQASVLTYQAYNTFGGHSAYADASRKATASSVVSFDRPYEDGGYYSPYQYELPLIREMEKLGIDVDYFTDVDVDADPAQLELHRGIVTGGHSEYWTKRMYDGAVAARQAGVNLAFFGANDVYTAVRLTGSPAGPDRRVVIRRTTVGDSVAAADPSQATVNWAEAPLNRPEAALVGQGYGYLGASGSLRVLHPDSWIFANTGVAVGQVLRNTVGGEYDQVEPNKAGTPRDIDVLAAMPMRYANGHAGMATTTYYVATSQAGVFDAGTTYWPCVIGGDCLHLAATPPESRQVITQMTDNILTAFAAGPAGLTHPSTPNLPPSAEGLVGSAKEPGDVSLRAY